MTEFDLTPSEQARYRRRFNRIYNWGRTLNITVPFYRDLFLNESPVGQDEWFEVFDGGIRPPVRKMLAAKHAPDIDDLLACGWTDKGAIGSYAKIALSLDEDVPNVIYIGFSGTSAGSLNSFGINNRRKTHEQNWDVNNKLGGGFAALTFDNRHLYSLRFVSLWVEYESRTELTETNLWYARLGAHFSEFILSSWLSSYRSDLPISKHANAWDLQDLDWIGSLSFHCMNEGWLEETPKLSVTGSAEYIKSWKNGEHLKGLLSEQERQEWVFNRKEKAKLKPYNIKASSKRKADYTEEEWEVKKAYRRDHWQKNDTSEEARSARSARDVPRYHQRKAEGWDRDHNKARAAKRAAEKEAKKEETELKKANRNPGAIRSANWRDAQLLLPPELRAPSMRNAKQPGAPRKNARKSK